MLHLASLRAQFGRDANAGNAGDSSTAESSRNPSPTLHLMSRDSPSLWNTSVNQGWSTPEEDILVKAIMKFGVGNWRAILDSGCLPGKNPAQMYLQTQRVLGQQSISEFTGLHVDIRAIGIINKSRTDVVRKNRLITNAGGKLTREELIKKLKQNKEKYEVPEQVWSTIELPNQDSITKLIMEKRFLLSTLEAEVAQVREQIMEVREAIAQESAVETSAKRRKKDSLFSNQYAE